MKRFTLLLVVVALALTPVSAGLARAQAQGYDIEVLVDSHADGFDPFGFGCPALDDRGQVAFTSAGPSTAPTSTTAARFTNLVLCREGLNNLGRLAFQAQLEDGRTVIVRATPEEQSV